MRVIRRRYRRVVRSKAPAWNSFDRAPMRRVIFSPVKRALLASCRIASSQSGSARNWLLAKPGPRLISNSLYGGDWHIRLSPWLLSNIIPCRKPVPWSPAALMFGYP